MALTEEQKKKIEEEEKYRAQVRAEVHEKPKKKGMSLLSKVLLIVFGFPLILAVVIIGMSPKGSTNAPSNTSEEKKELNR